MKISYWAFIFLAINNCLAQVQNSGFEELTDNTSPTKIPSWLLEQSEYKIGVDPIHAYSGTRSILIDGEKQNGYSLFYQFVPSKIENAKKYRLSAYLKYEHVDNGFVGLYVNVQGEKGTLCFDDMENSGLTGNGDWKRYSVEFIADETCDYIVIGGNLKGNGKAWFDEFAIEEVGKNGLSKRAKAFLDEAFSIIRQHSIKKDSINLDDLKNKMIITSLAAKRTRDCYASIKYALNRLSDNHSHFMEPEVKLRWTAPGIPANSAYAKGQIVEENIGYLKLSEFVSGNSQQITLYADGLQYLIRNMDTQKGIKGWIIDLRQNTGGNAYAMLAGIGPLLGNGICGYFIKPNERGVPWFYQTGTAGYNKTVMAKTSVQNYTLLRGDTPIAVLTSGKTASAGEVLTVSFRGRQRTKSFGEPTFGNTTNNEEFKLSDGSSIFLATSYYSDRNKNHYNGRIKPDFQLEQKTSDNPGDLVIQKAILWIRENQ